MRPSTLLGLLLVTAPLWAESTVEILAPYRQVRPDGAYVDWLDGHAGIVGRARILKDISRSKVFYKQVQQVAEDEGKAKLEAVLAQLWIDESSRLSDRQDLLSRMKILVDRTPAAEVVADSGQVFRVRLKIPLGGENGIIRLVLPEGSGDEPAGVESSPVDPVAQAPFDAGSAVAVEVPAGARDADLSTGLIIDARNIERPGPALLPRVVDVRGRLIYGAEVVDPDFARERGLAAYATRVLVKDQPPPILRPREGLNPLQVQAVSAGGSGNTTLVISESDADRILTAAAASPFLRECRVLILMPPAPIPPRPAVIRRRSPVPASAIDPNKLH